MIVSSAQKTPIWDAIDDFGKMHIALALYDQRVIDKNEVIILLGEIEIDKISFDYSFKQAMRLYDLQIFGAEQLLEVAKKFKRSPDAHPNRSNAFLSLFDKNLISEEILLDEVKSSGEYLGPCQVGYLWLELEKRGVVSGKQVCREFGLDE